MDEDRLGIMFGWCWESVLGEVSKVLSMSFSPEGVWSVECGVWSVECGVWSVGGRE